MKISQPGDNTMMMFGDGNFHDFPRLARESGFSFNLYRGRVDWMKISAIDVDRLIRERDLESLQEAILSILSCSLDNEYDLKVLDPNFVKLFRLAQLSVDYLQYCRRYLDHCVTVIQDQLRVALLEVEQLQKIQQHKEEDIKQLQKKLRGKLQSTSHPHSPLVPIFKCMSCKKVFVAEQYLLAHQVRRHPEMSVCTNTAPSGEIENLQQQVQQLQRRLASTEEALKHNQSPLAPSVVVNPSPLPDPKDMTPSNTRVTSDVNENKTSSSTIYSTKDSQHSELNSEVKLDAQVQTSDSFPKMMEFLEKIKSDYQADRTSLVDCVQHQNEEIEALRNQLLVQHQAHEVVLQKKLEELQHQHQTDLAELRSTLLSPLSGCSGDHIVISSAHSQTIQATSQNALQSSRACDKQEDAVNAVHSRGIGVHSLKEKNFCTLNLHSSASNTSYVSPIKQSKNCAQLTVSSPQKHNQNLTNILQECAVEEFIYSGKDTSSSSSSSHPSPLGSRSAIKEVDHLDSCELKSTQKEDSCTRDLSPESHGSKVDSKKTVQAYQEPTSSISDESVSGSGTSSYDSDSHSSPKGLEPQTNLKDLENLSRLELTPHLLDGLKGDLHILVDKRLRELGVDPEWDRLPAASFRSNLATVKHHQNIAARTHQSYFKIRDALIREVDRRVNHQTNNNKSPAKSTSKKKPQKSGSLSLLARLKSSVKNKLSPSGRSATVLRPDIATKNKKESDVENIYTSEPGSSSVKPDKHSQLDLSHEYETLSMKHNPKLSSDQEEQSHDEESSHSSNSGNMNVMDTVSSGTSVLSDRKSIDLSPPSKQKSFKSVKSFSRSMYANLDRSEITAAKFDTTSPDFSKLPHSKSPQTSTPIKSSSPLQRQQGISHQETKPLPPLIPSDVESISELESDFNEFLGNNHGVKLKTSGHLRMSRSTAELLADVAKLRQNSGQPSSSLPVFKSNLKSSVSAGNITKKKVVFRDEKDGFNTIELGPALASNSSVTLQRSHSDSDLSVSLSTEPVVPVPLPRSSLVPSSTQEKTYTDHTFKTNARPFQDQGKQGPSKDTLVYNDLPQDKDSAEVTEKILVFETQNPRNVLDIVQNIEKKLEHSKRGPLFGFKSSSARSPTMSITQDDSKPSVSGLQKDKSSMDDLISELLLDDLSSS